MGDTGVTVGAGAGVYAPPPAGPPASAAELYAAYEAATASLDPPFALVDLDAMWRNGNGMLSRRQGKALRVASKSLRCRALLTSILGREGFRGLMTFTLGESLWLHGEGLDDLLLAYPTTDRDGLRRLGRLEGERPPIVMADSTEHLDFIDAAAGRDRRSVRVCIELDVGFWLAGGRLKIGPKRSPIRTPRQAADLAREVVRRPGFELAGLMGYEGHIAGFGDDPPGPRWKGPLVRRMQSASAREIAQRRAAVVAAVRAVAALELVNGGGTGSLHLTAREPAVTEVTVGSGFYAPLLFDHYTAFKLQPAAMFALPVVRRPRPGVATLLGGGYHASGPKGADRLPRPYLPDGLRLDGLEGAGEVQTPVLGEPADRLRIGDRVYLRHAKAGELCERFDRLHLLQGGRIVDEVPTYRGEGRTFL
ncbi:MAG TPA: amino acid deaminase/aldolase [Solirubrobacteraceae bacterium]|jgi:D-serine deaminase-like pyridoxal phosphate-dependent protein|nr:amino acid deaminase/aldolase [Solirubrobacteraceae bacterium]